MKWIRAFGVVLVCLVLLLGLTGCATSDQSPQDDNRSPQSSTVIDATPPTSPANLAKTTPDNDNTPTFVWNAAADGDSGVGGYSVRMNGGAWMNLGDVTTYTCEYAVSDGTHILYVKAIDKAENEGGEGSCTFTCDTTAPTISGVSASAMTISGALITWTTSEGATSQVEYGTTSGYGSLSSLNSNLVTTHTVNPADLTAGTTYHYRVKSRDAAGNEALSADATFTTAQPARAVYCVGDSLTAADVYEARLRDLLGSSYTVVNKGVGSAHTSYMLAQFQTNVLSQNPGFVVIWGGINDILHGDSLADTKSNLQAMYTQAHNQGIQVIAVSISPCKGCSDWTESAQAAIDELNAWIATTATDIDYRIDVYSLLEDPSNPDCLLPAYAYGGLLHLTTAGYNVVGQAIYDGTAAFHV